MSRDDLRSVLLAPVLAWLALLGALGVTFAYACLPGVPGKLWAGLAIAGVKAAVIGLVFMRLTRAAALLRLTAAVGLLWLSLLFILGFCDVLTRAAEGR